MVTYKGQLDRIRAAGGLDALDLLVVAGLGLVGSFAVQCAAPCARRIVMLDNDIVTETTTLLATYRWKHVGRPKADVMLQFVRGKFRHLRGPGRSAALNADVRTIGEGFWRAASRVGRAVMMIGLDNFEAVDYVARMARGADIPTVVTTVGRDACEALVFPADPQQACYSCIGLTGGESRPCLGRREDAAPTISTLDVGALSAGTATILARQLAAGAIRRSRDVRLTFTPDAGVRVGVAEVGRSPDCPCHGASAPVTGVSMLTTEDCWSRVAESLGDPKAALFTDTLPPIRRGDVEAEVPMREIGVPLWPIVSCELHSRRARVEMAGDAARLGLTTVLEAGRDSA